MQKPSFSRLLDEFIDLEKYSPDSPKAVPIRLKARKVSLAVRTKIEDEITRLIKECVLDPNNNNNNDRPKVSTPMVPVAKPSGDVRLCGDYKATVNKALPYSIPSPNICHQHSWLEYSSLSLIWHSLIYDCMLLNLSAADDCNTQRSFRVKWLQFETKVSPEIFRQVMEDLGNREWRGY